MRVMALCSGTPGEIWHVYKYPHLKPEENYPRVLLETLWGTSNPGKLHTQQTHPKEEGGQPTWDSTLPKIQLLLHSGSA